MRVFAYSCKRHIIRLRGWETCRQVRVQLRTVRVSFRAAVRSRTGNETIFCGVTYLARARAGRTGPLVWRETADNMLDSFPFIYFHRFDLEQIFSKQIAQHLQHSMTFRVLWFGISAFDFPFLISDDSDCLLGARIDFPTPFGTLSVRLCSSCRGILASAALFVSRFAASFLPRLVVQFVAKRSGRTWDRWRRWRPGQKSAPPDSRGQAERRADRRQT